ncbi:unnamed protein product [Protopolystoma xenopodis]|uniref:Uncharacterized protein n=1 Tax=Protopolystoma xenopodis TaxID=117903 RepID=A0A3S5C271_9PLAT|nr:unnamed protein product [Protopolystoma xenopodis]
MRVSATWCRSSPSIQIILSLSPNLTIIPPSHPHPPLFLRRRPPPSLHLLLLFLLLLLLLFLFLFFAIVFGVVLLPRNTETPLKNIG